MTARESARASRVLVLADGAAPSRSSLDAAWPGWDHDIDLVIAADGGARLAGPLGLTIDLWVGDGDSLGEAGIAELRAAGVRVQQSPIDKDATDAELGLLAAVAAGASEVTVLGALGGTRFDHALANVLLLAHPALAGSRVQLMDGRTRVRLLDAQASSKAVRLDLAGRVGDLVSLIPLEDLAGVTTTGLHYPLRDEDLRVGPARGVSNLRTRVDASVSIRSGRLLVVEAPATLPR